MSNVMRQEWADFCQRNKCHPEYGNYEIARTAFWAGWQGAIKRLQLPDDEPASYLDEVRENGT